MGVSAYVGIQPNLPNQQHHNMSYRPSARRSRSPVENSHSHPHPSASKPHRSRSPRVSHHHSSSHKRARTSRPVILPLEASTLSKYDYDLYKPMFGLYLDIQKQLILEELSDDEVRGRWKSFVGKWYAWSYTLHFCCSWMLRQSKDVSNVERMLIIWNL